MIDPIEVANLDSMFEQWLNRYHDELRQIPEPIILVDSSLPGHLDLMTEMDLILDKFKSEATIESVSSDNALLNEKNLVLCITRQGSMISTLAQVRIYGVVKTEMGQIWEIRDTR